MGAKPQMREYFNLRGLKVRDVKLFFKTLVSLSPDQTLAIEDFVNGCMKVKGGASSLDMQALKLQAVRHQELLEAIASATGVDNRPNLSFVTGMSSNLPARVRSTRSDGIKYGAL